MVIAGLSVMELDVDAQTHNKTAVKSNSRGVIRDMKITDELVNPRKYLRIGNPDKRWDWGETSHIVIDTHGSTSLTVHRANKGNFGIGVGVGLTGFCASSA